MLFIRGSLLCYYRKKLVKKKFSLRAPSKAGANKLDNPTRVMLNQQPGTEPRVWQGNEPCEAGGRAVGQPQCESVKVRAPK